MSDMPVFELLRRVREELPAVELGRFLYVVNAARLRLNQLGTWGFMSKEQSIALSAPITAGTVTVTNGSATIVGVGTGWNSAITGRQFRKSGDSVSYTITFLTATTATIVPAYQEATEAGADYIIFQELYSLVADTSKIVSVINLSNSGYEMRVGTQQDYFRQKRIGGIDPTNALDVAEWGLDSSGNRQLAFLNGPVTADEILVYYYARPTDIVDIIDTGSFFVEPFWFREVLFLEILGQYMKRQNPRNEPRISENRREFGEAMKSARAEDSQLMSPRRRNARQFPTGHGHRFR